MEKLEQIMLWAFGILAWMSVALSSFHTQDQQLAGLGGFDLESCRHMIFFGWLSTGLFCIVAYFYSKVKAFLYVGVVMIGFGYLWCYHIPHPITNRGMGGWSV